MASEAQAVSPARRSLLRRIGIVLLAGASILVVSALIWQGITASGNPDPAASHLSPHAAIVDTGLLVFREGLEMILVLAAITASMKGSHHSYQRPIAAGAGFGFIATLITWFIAVGILSSLADSIPALELHKLGMIAIAFQRREQGLSRLHVDRITRIRNEEIRGFG